MKKILTIIILGLVLMLCTATVNANIFTPKNKIPQITPNNQLSFAKYTPSNNQPTPLGTLYITISSSGIGGSDHVYLLPLILRIIKHRGLAFLGNIQYYAITARTTIWEYNTITQDLHLYELTAGPHQLFIHGLYWSFLSPITRGGHGRVIGISLLPPTIT